MMDRSDISDDLGLTKAELDAWEAVEAPPGFPDEVMASALAEEKAASRPQPNRVWVGVAVVAAAAVCAVVFWPSSQSGTFAASDRQEIDIERAILVAEAGSLGSFEIDDGDAVIEQEQGNVFYRVESGGTFEVRTPAGTVSVKGTCFRVEVKEMRLRGQTIAGTVLGATVAAALVVTVYEGRVAVANDHGETELIAGQTVTVMEQEAPPEPEDMAAIGEVPPVEARPHDWEPLPDPSDIDQLELPELQQQHHALIERASGQADQVQRLQERVRELEAEEGVDEDLFYPTSQSDLERMAERCEIRADHPPVMGLEPGNVGQHAETLNLTPEETEAMQDAINRTHERFRDYLRELYVEATGDTEGVNTLSPEALMAELEHKSAPPENGESLILVIAQERAGHRAIPPEDEQEPGERALRRFGDLGSEFQSILAQSLGSERADELRRAHQGWPWSHSRFRGCN